MFSIELLEIILFYRPNPSVRSSLYHLDNTDRKEMNPMKSNNRIKF